MEERVGNRGGVTGFMSERMLRTAGFVSRGNRTADVGCDHAYTSIYLVEQGIAPQVIAMDVNAGPLARATENVRRFGMEDRIALRLSDGLEMLLQGEADTILIGGMGGPLMERILTAYPEKVAGVKELVLQPQSEIAEFRRFIQRIGFRITEEDMLFEDGKYYTILRAEHGADGLWTEEEYRYGKCLRETAVPVLRAFLEEEHRKAEAVLEGLTVAGTEKAEGRMEEIRLRLVQNETMAKRLAK